ncbi:CPBP family intramembrane glutamic endopeptidase [Halorussus pelagicus]|uniref:CPBP family intramembrane glutamic endopeptidase n=1 Tax=Halorussus pelagicus TaxID=2505977 RepID=UPI000FFB8637|nr:CPBP family intramembrane glutamic endopeptidase [Halorussus pelagicus]
MLDTAAFWAVVAVLVPVLKAFYFPLANRLFGTFSDALGDPRSYVMYKYVLFVAALAVAFLLAVEPEISVPDSSVLAGTFVAGLALYGLDNAVWRAIADPDPSGTRFALVWPTLVGGAAEELLYRGALAVAIGTEGLAGIAFVAVSALAFGANHLSFGKHEVAFKTFDGVVYAVCLLATGSVLAPVVAHVGYNVAFVCWTSEIRDRVGAIAG